MLIDYRELSSVKRAVEVEIPADAVSGEVKKVTSEFARQARIPGFRAGKVPLHVVKNRFLKEIQEEVVDRLLPRFFRDAVLEKSEKPVGNPELKRVDALTEGSPIKFLAEFEIKPKVELREYRGIRVSEPAVEVTDADVEAILERYRESASSYRPVTDRGAGKDDYVVIDLVSSADGMETQRSEKGHVRLGEDSPLPELHESLSGKRPGDQVVIEKSYGEDAANEAFRGKNVRHEVTLQEIRVQEKPELNDGFARSAGPWEDLEAMRAKIREDLRRHRAQEALRAKRQQIGERLLETHEFDVPETMIEEELSHSLQNYARFLASQGVDIEKAEIDWRRVRDDFRGEAVKRVKRGLILEEIARKESLIVSDTEVDAEIRKAAHESKREFAEVRHRLQHDGGYEALRLTLSQDKAIEFLLGQAVVG